MANFEAPIVKVSAIEKHPNADRLEIAVVLGFRCIVPIGKFKINDLVVYIPEASIVPEWLIKELGLWDHEKNQGMLAGSNHDRVKIVKLRGVFSQGLLYPLGYNEEGLPFLNVNGKARDLFYHEGETLHMTVLEGLDCAEALGITKWEPPIPTHMSGQVANVFGHTVRYDIENIQKYPNVLENGEPVSVTEKIHGTLICIACDPTLDHNDLFQRETIIASKGLLSKGLGFQWTEENRDNLYVRAFKNHFLNEDGLVWSSIRGYSRSHGSVPVHIFGEVFGQGVQDLQYGLKGTTLRVFDVFVGGPKDGEFMSPQEREKFLEFIGLEPVPELYRGPFSMEVIEKYRDGKEFVSGNNSHVREGVVIQPMFPRTDRKIGRVILKAVSPDYLNRKGETTEFN